MHNFNVVYRQIDRNEGDIQSFRPFKNKNKNYDPCDENFGRG